MGYQIIWSDSEDVKKSLINLEQAVKRFIEEGWEPLGGVCSLRENSKIYFMQAMICSDDL